MTLDLKAENKSVQTCIQAPRLLFGCLPRGKWRIRPSASAPTQSAHSGPVTSVAFSPDGTTIGAGSDDKTLKVWDAGVWTLTPPTLSPNLSAPTLAAASLELKGEKESAHDCPVLSVAFSPKGNTIVSASGDIDYGQGGTNTIHVWDSGVSALTPSNP